ncbi:deoxyuridine 5'-triphosphate nucleotidohydrolase [Sulfobacillus thermosulfidooxidans DSM 9293]|uniref:dUTP diphosphatase n=1 Tax=Sulfobacillus thermosulfidooxidans (strain DSM 9293 / VKM B-1269 / AT-1) TaxID=929705 RepID=A0A1W1WJB0_SULTA|nr:dUTPase [Sulfobacillus thermosulfidooxidans]SMC06282.1 deoxyuridine 5'-triphosphate nucleotidohydrolase [Sulfobacillus thermosulfidooxidans DSM 9293]
MPTRSFAVITQYQNRNISLPKRHTKDSAGYDLASAEMVTLNPGEIHLVPTGLKVYMPPGEVLLVIIRSSWAVKKRCVLANQVGVIDRDYVDNPDNEGHIFIPIENRGPEPVIIKAGERIAQGIFVKFGVTDNDISDADRQGGFGSTTQ